MCVSFVYKVLVTLFHLYFLSYLSFLFLLVFCFSFFYCRKIWRPSLVCFKIFRGLELHLKNSYIFSFSIFLLLFYPPLSYIQYFIKVKVFVFCFSFSFVFFFLYNTKNLFTFCVRSRWDFSSSGFIPCFVFFSFLVFVCVSFCCVCFSYPFTFYTFLCLIVCYCVCVCGVFHCGVYSGRDIASSSSSSSASSSSSIDGI